MRAESLRGRESSGVTFDNVCSRGAPDRSELRRTKESVRACSLAILPVVGKSIDGAGEQRRSVTVGVKAQFSAGIKKAQHCFGSAHLEVLVYL